MAYLLPRAFLVLMAWGMTCGLIRNLWPEADATIYAVTGLSWACAGTAYFAYLRKLRRDIDDLARSRGFAVDRSATSGRQDQAAPPARFQPRARLP